MQLALFTTYDKAAIHPPSGQLLKWIGSKHRFAPEIVSHFPRDFGTYIEPFLGSGAVLATLTPARAVGADMFGPLVEIWRTLVERPAVLKAWYAERFARMAAGDKVEVYEQIKASYNAQPNGPDLLFLCRACYGGVVRFRKSDGYMSTPCGIHDPISPVAFNKRVVEWHDRAAGVEVKQADYHETLRLAQAGDLVYCDPPYAYSQSILYGAQSFDLEAFFAEVQACKLRGVFVAVSIDGSKKSGNLFCHLEVPESLFEREIEIRCGRSMLRRFQMQGRTLEDEEVTDRLLLTY